MPACPACGFENAGSAKFCSECGTALAAPRPRREERKVVTVVFADLVGSTARAERLDPEDVRAILAPYHARLRRELERHGGTVEKFIGDAVVAVFGAPVAHEDDPERAVRAALAIQEAIAEMNEADPSLALEVRIGVNTGEALVALDARPELGEGMVSGDVVNTGARLQAAAPPGGILVGELTFRATERAVEYEAEQPVVAKGKAEAIPAWRAVARRASFGIDLSHTRSPLVGRDDELEVLAGALARARARLEPQLVTVVGVPGIGKSRLVRELFRTVDEDPELIVWRQGRSLPYGEGSAFWALAEIVKAQTGILETDGADEAAVKVGASVHDLVPDETEGPWIERHLLSLTGVQQTRSSGQVSLDEAFAAWRRFLEALAERQPVVLVFEDLHWADDALLDFVDSLPDRVSGVPLLVVCSARPELLERRPAWGGGKRNAATVSLAPLSDEDTARLLAGLLGAPVLPADQQAALLQRAGGNPLFAEEYARMLAGGGQPAAAAPETLHGVVAARIDALPGEEKELLQLAAVLGKVFWTDALALLSGVDPWQLDERLHALERKEFVRREHRSAVAGSKQYVFVHALVRDGAYGQMSRAARGDVHRRAADWIETLPADRADDRAEMLAHHLLQAVEYGRAAGHDVSALVPRAVPALRDAGDRSWALGAPHAALELYEQARSLDPGAADDPYLLVRLGRALTVVRGTGERELDRAASALAASDSMAAAEAEIARGELVWQRGDQEGAFRRFDRAASLVENAPDSPQKAYVVAQLARFLALAGRHSEAGPLAEQAIAMAERFGDTELLGDVLNTRGIVRSSLGRSGWRDDFERSLELALENNSWRATRAYLNLGSTLVSSAAELERAEHLYREGLRLAERRGSPLGERWFRGNLAETAFHLGLWEEALRLADGELAHPESHYMQHQCRYIRAFVRLERGDARGALDDADTAVEEARAIRDPQALIPALTCRLLCAARTGDAAAAAGALAELEDSRRALETDLAGPWVVDLAFALLELGREAELLAEEGVLAATPWRDAALGLARGDLVGAADRLHALGSRALEARARLRAARRFSADGRRAEAADHLARALSFYRDVSAPAAVREAEALLAAAS
jgi:class 3 adenylate cyclase/tetratricopeptide (TPR) repeat protein